MVEKVHMTTVAPAEKGRAIPEETVQRAVAVAVADWVIALSGFWGSARVTKTPALAARAGMVLFGCLGAINSA